jgi:hypothetical protein
MYGGGVNVSLIDDSTRFIGSGPNRFNFDLETQAKRP